MNIILCGYMGSGKSLIGRKLSEKMAKNFLDLDEEIVRKKNTEIYNIFSEKGEIYFRKVEIEVLKETLKQLKNSVLALGGGTPCYGNNLEEIKTTPNTVLVYLKMNIEPLTNRLWKNKNGRPLLKNIQTQEKLNEYIRKHLFERQFYYLQSDLKIDVSNQSPDEIVNAIVEKLNLIKK